jgi:hypothetical protein
MSEPTKKPLCGQKYRISDGRYTGRWCRVQQYSEATHFCTVMLMDAWGKETKERDAIPAKFLEYR